MNKDNRYKVIIWSILAITAFSYMWTIATFIYFLIKFIKL